MPLRALIAEVISLSKRFKYTNDTSGEPHSHKKDTTFYLIFQDSRADFNHLLYRFLHDLLILILDLVCTFSLFRLYK